MSDWLEGCLADSIASLDAGVSVNAEDRPHGAGEIGVLKTSAVSGGTFHPEQNKTVVERERHLVAEPVQGDSILVSRMNTPALVGESCYVRDPQPSLFLPDRLWQLKPKNRSIVDMRWLSFTLQSAACRRHVEIHATGTSGSMKNLPKSKLLALPVRYPAPEEQVRIAQILDTLDTAIHDTESIIAKLKAVKQGLLHDLLTRGIDANGELRLAQAEVPHLYKESPLGWIPKAWNASVVDIEFTVDSGITLGAHRAPRSHPRKYLRVANVHRARLVLDDIAELEASDSETAVRALEPGDLLVVEGHASTDEIGRCAIADESVRGMLFQNHLFRLRPKRLLPSYALLWMNSAFVRAYWRCEAATSSGLNTINRSKLRRLRVAVPTPEEQEMIAGREACLASRIKEETRVLGKLKTEKSGLMDDLLTGRVRVTPLLESTAPLMHQPTAPIVQQPAAQTRG
ncbi:restriction endonuclease subunit S [Thauera sp. WH-1]|uniref:restriction endonuclease subunit S n=1 Tax=Thauera sp. WH-1 TaxID=3398230 RepID=UPI0039FC39AB